MSLWSRALVRYKINTIAVLAMEILGDVETPPRISITTPPHNSVTNIVIELLFILMRALDQRNNLIYRGI